MEEPLRIGLTSYATLGRVQGPQPWHWAAVIMCMYIQTVMSTGAGLLGILLTTSCSTISQFTCIPVPYFPDCKSTFYVPKNHPKARGSTYIRDHMGAYTCLYMRAYTCLYMGAYTCLYMGAYTCLNMGAYTCLLMGSYTCLYMGAYTCLYMGVCTCLYRHLPWGWGLTCIRPWLIIGKLRYMNWQLNYSQRSTIGL